VLSTVGVCVGRDEDALKIMRDRRGGDRAKLERVVTENEVGLGIAAAELGLTFALMWWTFAFRSRLQVTMTAL